MKRLWKGEIILIDETTLFGKYRVIRIIGKGASGTVYLAEHEALKELRAVKAVSADESEGTLTSEVRILKSLRHPGIPIVYDIERDERYIYLIEEFIEGDSLKALIEDKGILHLADIIRYGCELCHIIAFLHSNKPDPIYYLDLQPNNVLICRGTLKLIDFDRALFKSQSGTSMRYGTPGFSAPELASRNSIDERADLYAIGALLYYMAVGFPPAPVPDYRAIESSGLVSVLKKCLAAQKEYRYKSVLELEKALISLKGKENDKKWPLLKIAVCGSRPGVGVTHTTFRVSKYLESKGFGTYVQEKNNSRAFVKAAEREGQVPDDYGVYHLERGRARPFYGPGVNLEKPVLEVEICDLGGELKRAYEDDYHLILLLCGAESWEMEDSENAIQYLSCRPGLRVFFCSANTEKPLVFKENMKGITCFRYPERMRENSPEEQDFYESVFEGSDVLMAAGGSRRQKKTSEGRSSVWDYFRKRK